MLHLYNIIFSLAVIGDGRSVIIKGRVDARASLLLPTCGGDQGDDEDQHEEGGEGGEEDESAPFVVLEKVPSEGS